MLKRTFILFFLFFSFQILSAQDIRYFFKILPQSYTPELNAKTKDSLLEGKNYYPADNDKDQIIVYEMTQLDTLKNFLSISMSFKTGQRGFDKIEVRSFKAKSGNFIVVFSDYSGVPVSFYQNNLSVFSYRKNKSLIKISSLGLISKVKLTDFLKPNTPDSIAKKFEIDCNISYHLDDENITLTLETYNFSAKLYYWLLGDEIEFIWNGERFIKQKPKFDE